MSARRKPCRDCGGPKPSGRARKLCNACAEQNLAERRHRRTGIRGLMLMPRYGITIEEYDALADSQDGVCAICRQERPATGRLLRLAVDHDHATGEVRGLVCQRCNMALHFLENATWRSDAEAYLASPPAGRCEPLLAGEAASLAVASKVRQEYYQRTKVTEVTP